MKSARKFFTFPHLITYLASTYWIGAEAASQNTGYVDNRESGTDAPPNGPTAAQVLNKSFQDMFGNTFTLTAANLTKLDEEDLFTSRSYFTPKKTVSILKKNIPFQCGHRIFSWQK